MADDKRTPAPPQKPRPAEAPEKGLDPQRSGRTPDSEPPKDKRKDDL